MRWRDYNPVVIGGWVMEDVRLALRWLFNPRHAMVTLTGLALFILLAFGFYRAVLRFDVLMSSTSGQFCERIDNMVAFFMVLDLAIFVGSSLLAIGEGLHNLELDLSPDKRREGRVREVWFIVTAVIAGFGCIYLVLEGCR